MGSDVMDAANDYVMDAVNEMDDDILIDILKERGYQIFYNGDEC